MLIDLFLSSLLTLIMLSVLLESYMIQGSINVNTLKYIDLCL